MTISHSEAVATTPTTAHHLFGYYSICPWSADETKLICLESTFHDHPPEAGEKATIGYVDTTTGEWTQLSETLAWNLQQGTMLHWLPALPNTHIVHNDLDGRKLVSRLVNVESGESELIASMSTIIQEFDHPEEMASSPIWFNHVGFSPNDSRIFFLARYCEGGHGGPLNSAMFTVNPDGSDLRKVVDYGQRVSHFEWKNDSEIVVTIEWENLGRAFVIFTDGEDDHRLMDPKLVEDGHMTYSPDRRWLLSDIGPREHPESMSTLRLYDTETTELHILGEYHTPEPYRGDIRCDLHPRWNHAGDKISFDCIHEGTRQVYTMNLILPPSSE